jgi:hypothetical protein
MGGVSENLRKVFELVGLLKLVAATNSPGVACG